MHGLHARFITDIKNGLVAYAIHFPMIKKNRNSAYTYHTSILGVGEFSVCELAEPLVFSDFSQAIIEKARRQVKHCRD